MNKLGKKLVLLAGACILFCSLSGCLLRPTGTDKSPGGETPLIDTDNDGIPNISDNDIDNDKVPNATDPDVDNDGQANGADPDVNGDGLVNNVDPDVNGDGLVNNVDPDVDGDGLANNVDPDIDGDGIPNAQDPTPDGAAEAGNGEYVSGIGIVAVDTVGYTLKINASQSAGMVSTTETIDLGKVRDAIADNGIALSTFSLANLGVKAEQNQFVQTNSATRVVITVSYLDANNTKVPVLESASREGLAGPVLTIGDLASGLKLNSEIFAVPGGFPEFTDMIKDESKSSVSTVIDINFLDAPAQGGADLDVNFILTAVGKMPL